MNKSFSSRAIAKRILVSALTGVLISALVTFPITLALFQYYVIGNDYWLRPELFRENVLRIISSAPFFALVGVILTAPLIVLSILCGIVFRRSIQRHLALWSAASPFVVWVFVSVFEALTRNNEYFRTHSFHVKFITSLLSIDSLLYLFSPMAAAVAFYVMSRRSLAAGAQAC